MARKLVSSGLAVCCALLLLGWAMLPAAQAAFAAPRASGTVEPVLGLPVADLVAVTQANALLRFNSGTPGTITSNTPITGLQVGETIRGIDFRPATGDLYAVGSTSRLYTIDLMSGAATIVGTNPLTTTLAGTAFGVDFNPVPDRLRIVSDSGQNLRVNPANAVTIVDGTLAYAAGDPNAGATPSIVASAYTNSYPGTTTTTLYNLDSDLNILVSQNPPNAGTLNTIGALGADISDQSSLAITPDNVAFASSSNGVTSTLYSVNLSTGATGSPTTIGVAESVVAIAVVSPPINAYALTSQGTIVGFNTASPSVPLSLRSVVLSLQEGTSLVAIDYRPATQELYGISNGDALYIVDPSTGSTQPAIALTVPLTGSEFGVDFNPVVDRLRIVSNDEQNLRVNPADGAALVDGSLAYAAGDPNAGADPTIVAAGYISNTVGTATTRLYTIDAGLDILAIQNPPNNGTLTTVGALGVDTSNLVGLDVLDDGSNTAYASLTSPAGSTSELYTLDLGTGAATLIGTIAGGAQVRDIALVLTAAPPTAVTVTTLATVPPASWPLALLTLLVTVGGLILAYRLRVR